MVINEAAAPVSDAGAIRPGDRVLVLVNPVAWRTRVGNWQDGLRAALGPEVDLQWTTPARVEDVADVVARASGAGARAVVVAGGDGTVSRAIEALSGTDTLLGLLPLGTGNDLVRELGLPVDVDAAIARLASGRERVIDLVEVNGRPYATVGLIGVTADGAVRVQRWQAGGGVRSRLPRVLGRQVYRVAGALSLLAPRRVSSPCRFVIDPGRSGERTQSVDVYGLFIANGRRLGSGLVLPVEAVPDDGAFEVCAVRRVNRAALLWAFACFTQGWRVPDGVLDVSRAASAVVEWPRPAAFSADGEILLTSTRFDLRIRPRALRVIT